MTELIIAFTLGFYLGPAVLFTHSVFVTEIREKGLTWYEIAVTALVAGLLWPASELQSVPRE